MDTHKHLILKILWTQLILQKNQTVQMIKTLRPQSQRTLQTVQRKSSKMKNLLFCEQQLPCMMIGFIVASFYHPCPL